MIRGARLETAGLSYVLGRGGFWGLAVARVRWWDGWMMMKALLGVMGVVVLGACASGSSNVGGVKVFNTRAELAQAMREGKIKQGDKVAVREGNLDDVPGMTKQ